MYDREAERAVLAACLQSTLARQEARKHLTGADFWQPAHEAVWDAIGRLDRHGRTVDAVTVNTVTTGQAKELLPELVTLPVVPATVGQYARIVRGWSTKRRIQDAAQRALQQALSPDVNPVGYAASLATTFASIRDAGIDEDPNVKTLAEVLSEPDDEPDWLIPGLLERRDRLVLTGTEGTGKSLLLRQIAVCGAAGTHPWEPATAIQPITACLFDCENTEPQIRRVVRPLVDYASRWGQRDPAPYVTLRATSRLDLTRDKDLAEIHRVLDAVVPDLVVIGPLYRLVPHAVQTDDEAVPLLAALDTIRDRGIAVLVEAHAGHALGRGGLRDMRPRGSSALLGWPEFGYGMREGETRGHADLVPWRGNRSERDFPERLHYADGYRWMPGAEDYGAGVA